MAGRIAAISDKFNNFRKSISTKVVLIILILVLPVNILAIVLSNMAIHAMTEQAKISVSNVMENYLTDLQHRMENTGYLLWNLKKEGTYGMLQYDDEADDEYRSAKIKMYHNFNDNILLANGADSYFFYIPDLDDMLVWDTNVANKIDGQAFVRAETENGVTSGWSFHVVEDKPIWCMFVDIDGVLYGGWIYLDQIVEQLAGDIHYEQTQIYFSTEAAGLENQQLMTVSMRLRKDAIWLNMVLRRKEIIGGISVIYRVMQIGAVLALLLIPVLYGGISHLLLAPLRAINHAQKKLREGNLDYRIEENANSIEYQYSYQSFNQMADQIKTLKIENYEKELGRQEMELKNLQLQIRPHFLLNTFNLVYTLTQRKDIAAAQNVVIYLSNYFRYLCRSGKDLELFSKEQRLIEGYIEVVRLRYPQCIAIEYDYDPEIYFVRLPPLILHNFIENIIKHVVKEGTLTQISVSGRYADGEVSFTVVDDGPGMSEEDVVWLDGNMRRSEVGQEHIGFANSLKRLKHFYGPQADIIINAEKGMGTSITIQFPYDLEVLDDTFGGSIG